MEALLIVQKYGGTSVGTTERIQAVADRVARAVSAGLSVAVVVSAMGHTTDQLVSLSEAMTKRPSAREMDALLSTGEQVSAALLAMALMERGVPARSFTGRQAGIQTEPVYGSARVASIDTKALQEALADGVVPVITGFQGYAGDDVTTLGRGGSDTTAVAIAAVLKADRCEIFTDVSGVYTTDPRMVPSARKLAQVSYDEMLELANLGAQVLHPRAVENAKRYQVPLVVRSSFTEEEGTYVTETSNLEQTSVVTGIAFEREVARVAVIGVSLEKHGLAAVFGKLAREGVNVDVIVQSVVQTVDADVSFTVRESDADATLQLMRAMQEELAYRHLVLETQLAKVSIVGAGMISNPGVAARMFEVLAQDGIEIKMVSTSEIKVSCIIAATDMERAVTSLHQAFLESDDQVGH